MHTTLLILWTVSLIGTLALLLRGYRTFSTAPVSYEFDWHPRTWVSSSLVPWGRGIVARAKAAYERGLHRIFHVVFHWMKGYHDRIFGSVGSSAHQGTPSFFLKTIAEHKEETIAASSEERKNGLS